MALNTPKRVKVLKSVVQSPGSDCNSEWQNDDDDDESVNKSVSSIGANYGIGNGSISPVSSCDSPEFPLRNTSNNSSNVSANSTCYAQSSSEARENRRGRPRSEALTTLMIEGSTSPSSIKCTYCNRVFPREKSLQAHLRTHTGERPYACDYPGCTRAFTQSGQLKTHQRLHTGERPFMCVVPQCQMRFTHANRHCPEHPYDQLKRCDDFVIQAVTEQNYEVIKWLEKYKMEKEDRTPTRKTPKRTKHPLSDDIVVRRSHCNDKSNENFNINRCYGSDENKFPVTPNNPYKSRKGLMVELDMNAGLGTSPIAGTKLKPTPKTIRWQETFSQEEDSPDESELPTQSTFNPKKRWLREAWQNDLAKPLEPNISSIHDKSTNTENDLIMVSKQTTEQNRLNPNQLRPTVLMVAAKNRTMPLIHLSTTAKNNEASQFIEENSSQSKDKSFSLNDTINNLPATSLRTHKSNANNDKIDNSFDRKNEIESIASVSSSAYENKYATAIDGRNQWLGALALMELATDEIPSTKTLNYNKSSTD